MLPNLAAEVIDHAVLLAALCTLCHSLVTHYLVASMPSSAIRFE